MAGVPTTYLGKCNFETQKWSEVKKGFTQFQNDDVIFAKITPCFENGKAVVIKNSLTAMVPVALNIMFFGLLMG